LAHSGALDALVAFERIGTRRSYARNDEIFAEGNRADCWFKVVSGAVRELPHEPGHGHEGLALVH